jgi:hypothetical protein
VSLSLLDDARRLAEWRNAPYHSNEWGMMWCGCCNGSMDTYLDHKPDCLFTQTMPRLLAVLESAEHVVAAHPDPDYAEISALRLALRGRG